MIKIQLAEELSEENVKPIVKWLNKYVGVEWEAWDCSVSGNYICIFNNEEAAIVFRLKFGL